MANPPIMPILFPHGDPLGVPAPPVGTPTVAPGLPPCWDVGPGYQAVMKNGVLTCVPSTVQGGSLDIMNIFGGGSNTWLWIAGGALALILLTSNKRGKR